MIPYVIYYGLGVLIGGLIIAVSYYQSRSVEYRFILDAIILDDKTVVSEEVARLIKVLTK